MASFACYFPSHIWYRFPAVCFHLRCIYFLLWLNRPKCFELDFCPTPLLISFRSSEILSRRTKNDPGNCLSCTNGINTSRLIKFIILYIYQDHKIQILNMILLYIKKKFLIFSLPSNQAYQLSSVYILCYINTPFPTGLYANFIYYSTTIHLLIVTILFFRILIRYLSSLLRSKGLLVTS
jgi:hypothetical protein